MPAIDVEDLARRRKHLAESMPMWVPASIDQRLDASARLWADRTYLVFGEREHTYGDTVRRSRQIAARLSAAGVRKGTHVGLLMANSFDLYATMYAIARLGAWSVPLNYFLAPAELAYVVSHSQCSVVVVDPDVPGGSGIDLLERTLAEIAETGSGSASVSKILVTASGSLARSPRFEYETFEPNGDLYTGESNSSADDVSHLYYTSGSTALPKAVTETHDAMLREAYVTAMCRAYDSGWRVLIALPPFHIFGLMQAVFAVTFVGGTAIVEKTFEADHALAQVARHQVRDIIAVPAMSQRLVVAAEKGSYDFSSLTALFTAGNAVPASSWQEIQRVLGVAELGTGYGMTEAPGIVFIAYPEDGMDVLTETVGRPKIGAMAGIPGLGGLQHQVMIVNRETSEPVDDGEDGEILIAGPTVTRGYFNGEQDNAKSFHQGFLRTGDVGHLRDDGCLVLTGRVKEMYKSGGENVTPKEVEAALYTHPAVGQVVVVGVPDPQWGESGCAWVVPVNGMTLTPEELSEHCRGRLARYKVPRTVYLIDASELPLTGLGKIKRQDLVDMAVEREKKESKEPL
jgi:fatty-acyl-CoA synthase